MFLHLLYKAPTRVLGIYPGYLQVVTSLVLGNFPYRIGSVYVSVICDNMLMVVGMHVVSTEVGSYTGKTMFQFISNVIGIKHF